MKKYVCALLMINSTALLGMNSRLKNVGSYLARSAEYGDYDDVKRRLDSGVDVDQEDNGGYTALDQACEKGLQKIALLLLERGADPFKGNRFISTPLHHAIYYRMVTVCDALLKNVALAKMPAYEKSSYRRLLTVLCCLSLETSVCRVPREVMLSIISFADDLCLDLVKVIFSHPSWSLKDKCNVAQSLIGKDAICKVLSGCSKPQFDEYFTDKGEIQSETAPSYVGRRVGSILMYDPEDSVTDDQRLIINIYCLLRQDTFEERLPGLIKKWFFTL